jgi:hypothetical protein
MKLMKALLVAIVALFVAAPVLVNADDATPLFTIVKAEYGDKASGKTIDVTEKVKAAVKDDKLSVKASNANFTDPAVGVGKKLFVTVSYNGKELEFVVNENQEMTIDKAKLDAAFAKAGSCCKN